MSSPTPGRVGARDLRRLTQVPTYKRQVRLPSSLEEAERPETEAAGGKRHEISREFRNQDKFCELLRRSNSISGLIQMFVWMNFIPD